MLIIEEIPIGGYQLTNRKDITTMYYEWSASSYIWITLLERVSATSGVSYLGQPKSFARITANCEESGYARKPE
jgi:hypothetical protein